MTAVDDTWKLAKTTVRRRSMEATEAGGAAGQIWCRRAQIRRPQGYSAWVCGGLTAPRGCAAAARCRGSYGAAGSGVLLALCGGSCCIAEAICFGWLLAYWIYGQAFGTSSGRGVEARGGVARRPGGEGPGGERRREAHTVMPNVAREPLLLSLGLGAAGGILRWI
uniref:Uncharacterized protein n=1 Tax=Leersia perrieri TaxID=77586 RepID=A0A0D9WTJ7_9ORYZ